MRFWPETYTEPPQPWTVPLSISAIGKLAYVDKIKQDDERMKYMNWTGQLEIPIQAPRWLLENYGAFIHNGSDDFLLVLDIFRFSRTTTMSADEWRNKWFKVDCYPHFSFLPCGKLDDPHPDYKRIAFVKDEGLQPYVLYHSYRECRD